MAENNQASDAVANMEAGPGGDSMDDVEEVEEIQGNVTDDKVNLVLQNPQVLASLQHQLDSLVGQRSGYIESLPKVVKRRIKALKKLQLNHTKLEAKFYEEVHQLECKYAKLYENLYDKRKDIVTAHIEPTDSDCEWESSDDEEEEEEGDNKLADELKEKAQIEDKEEENPSGIPEFWLTILKNVDLLADMVQEHDEPILKHLKDVKVQYCDNPNMGFTLEFHFEENVFFTNQVLKKHYTMKCEPDESDPFSYEGPEIISSVGCTIDWKKGKNITVRLVKKKQKHKGKGTTRVVTKTEQNDSFFNFFSPPAVPKEGVEVDEETESLLSADFEIGHFFKERVVPRAVLYFTGEAIEDEFEEEEEEVNEEEEDEDSDYDPSKDNKPSECKQQ
ncbi:nucleosome assembly protein 1-like 1 isoform X2 [Antedon mediterranea]|uniref:nucleosome assembly protein 1-like 1 isoform X2 n=1 Tax=Antedon mediterranea TaxID=105859 RepID=UPI003AF661DB